MRPRVQRELAVLATSWAGCLALAIALSGPVRAALAAAAALLALAPLVRRVTAALPWPVVTIPVIVALLAEVAAAPAWATHGLALALLYLLVHRSLARVDPSDDRVSLLVATLLLVFAASRTSSPSFLVPLAVWTFSAPAALLLASAESAGRIARTARPGGGGSAVLPVGPWLPLGMVLATALLFLAIPRLHGASEVLARAPVAATGFADEVRLGDLAPLLDDPTPVMRVYAPGDPPLYIRGMALDRFDGVTWSRSTPFEPVASRIAREGGDAGTWARVEELQPGQGALFTPGLAAWVEVPGARVLTDRDGNWAIAPVGRPVEYTVLRGGVSAAEPPPSEADLARWTMLPPDLDPRIASLSGQIAGERRDALARAEAIRAHLASEYAYARLEGARDANPSLAAFLFDVKAGHCEYFAAAEVVLLRAQGVPSRLVNGFVTADHNAIDGSWLVRRSDAHSWAEVLDGDTWVAVNPTPRAHEHPQSTLAVRASDLFDAFWRHSVVEYDLGVQARLILEVGRRVEAIVPGGAVATSTGRPWLGWAVGLLGLVVAGAAGSALARWSIRVLAGEEWRVLRGRVERAHGRARASLARSGWEIPGDLPPVAAARWVRDRVGDRADCLERLAWLHYEVRYGGADDAANARAARDLAAEVSRIGGPPA